MDKQAIWTRVTRAVLEAIEEHGTSRSRVSLELGHGKNTVTNVFRYPDETGGDDPNFDLALEVLQHLGAQEPVAIFSVSSDRPESLLSMLGVLDRGKDERATRKHRKTKAQKHSEEVVAAARSVSVPGKPEVFRQPWVDRREGELELADAYAEVERLEERRHRDCEKVLETCRREIVKAESPLDSSQACRFVGLLGIWASIKRVQTVYRPARDALSQSLALARRLGDRSLLARHLQRAAYIFRDLEEPQIAVSALDQATRYYSADGNDAGRAEALVDYGFLAFRRDDYATAESFYRRGWEKLPKTGHIVYRSAAAQGIATCLELQGDLTGALKFLRRCVEVADNHDPRLEAAILYTAANLERKRGLFSDAESKYWSVLRSYRRLEEADGVLRVLLDLIVCLKLSGRQSELGKLAPIVEEYLPKVKDRKSLRVQAELILIELRTQALSAELLGRLERGKCSRGV